MSLPVESWEGGKKEEGGGGGGGGKGLYYNTELNSPMGSQCSESYQRVHYKSSNGAKVK